MSKRTMSPNARARFWGLMARCCIGVAVIGAVSTVAMIIVMLYTGGAFLPRAAIPLLAAGAPVLAVVALLAGVFCLSRQDRAEEQKPEERRGRGYLGPPYWPDDETETAEPLQPVCRVSFRRDVFVALGAVVIVVIIAYSVAAIGPQPPEVCAAFGGELVCEHNFRAVVPSSLFILVPLTGVLALFVSWKISDSRERKRAEEEAARPIR